MEKVKKEELEVPEDLKETPKQRRWDGRVILISSLFLALVIFGAISYFSRTKPTISKPNVAVSTPTPVPTSDPTINWNTYVSAEGGLMFKYPTDWIIKKGEVDARTQLTDDASITPPNNKDGFLLSYDVYDLKKQIGGPFRCDNCEYTVIDQINPRDGASAYLVINTHTYTYKLKTPEYDQELSISEFKDKSKNDQGWPYVNSPTNSNLSVRWSGKYLGTRFGATGTCGPAGCATVSIDLKDFEGKPEVKTAIKIMKTFKFTDQTSVNTSIWKTFESREYNVSISYPNNWTINTSKNKIIFELNSDDSQKPRILFANDFLGDWCNAGPTEKSKITLNDGTIADKWDCGYTIVLQFQKNGDHLTLYADGITKETSDVVNKSISSFKFTQ